MYAFRNANKKDLDSFYNLIQERIKWMDEVGIKQWNVTDYNGRYPMSYYQDNLKDLYVLLEDDEVIAGSYLYLQDDRWPSDNIKAYYIHHFVTSLKHKGVGKTYLLEVEKLAQRNKIEYLRLDSAIDNKNLEEYYNSMNYVEVGRCEDGLYFGIRRQKKI